MHFGLICATIYVLKSESTGISAFAAQLLYGASALKALADSGGALGCKNFLYRRLVNIAETYYALSIKTAGDHGAVNEDAEVIGEAVAEYRAIALLAGDVRPLKAVAPLKVKLMADTISARAPLPFSVAEFLFNEIKGAVVSAAVVTFIPEAKDGEDTRARCSICEIEDIVYIADI